MKRHVLPIFLIISISTALYSNTLNNGFVYDDALVIVNNAFIKDIHNLSGLLRFEKDYYPLSGEISYRPVVTFTYFIDYALFGLKQWGFHLTNLLLHAINSILLYAFLNLFFKPSRGNEHLHALKLHSNTPLLITLLFTTHPILTEAVNAISFREDLLTFTFYMAALNLHAVRANIITISRSSSAFLYIASCLLYILALFSKEMAITLPLIAYCYEWLYKDKNNTRAILFNSYIIGYTFITLVYLYLRHEYFYNPFYRFYNPMEGNVVIGGFIERTLTLPWILSTYLKLSLFPMSLSADYAVHPIRHISDSSFLISFVTIFFILSAALIMAKGRREITFGILFFIITLIPVYNIIPLDHPFAERYLYLPAAGFAMAVGYSIYHLFTFRVRYKIQRGIIFILLFVILCAYFTLVIKRNKVWRDEYSLWSDTVKKQPSSLAYLNLGVVYQNNGLLDEAAKQYKMAIRLDPKNALAHNNLGLILLNKGQLDGAVSEFESAIRWKPDYAEAFNNLGAAHMKQRNYDEAIRAFKSASQLKPGYSKAHFNLGVCYYETGQSDEAIFQFRTVLELDPLNEKARDYLLRTQRDTVIINREK